MLFNSLEFIFLFLPATLAFFFLFGRRSSSLGLAWLCAASFFFYGYWNPRNLPLLVGSILFNYVGGSAIVRAHVSGWPHLAKIALAIGVIGNLLFLGYYKYSDLLIDTANRLAGTKYPLLHFVLPLGISFFTFTQIAYLVDCFRKEAKEYNLIRYVLFVTFFPHLIAGPILHHKEMIPQFGERRIFSPHAYYIAAGVAMFAIGLFKKVWLADSIAPIADAAFATAQVTSIKLSTAWTGALAYTLQIYFDFSGYSDMAIGISFMFGIRLPANFYSPYKATNIIEFWRRWHMTLSRFLRDYLYIPLGGNRKGTTRRYANLLVTMALGGLWHGAGWTFVIWGMLHGIYLVINHAWRSSCQKLQLNLSGRFYDGVSLAITFGAVVIAWVFFRSPNVATAMSMLQGMFGAGAIAGQNPTPSNIVAISLLLIIALIMPNSLQIMRKVDMALAVPPPSAQSMRTAFYQWRPSAAWGIATGLLSALAVFGLLLAAGDESRFLYFEF